MSNFINFNSFDVKKALKRKKGQISSDSDSEQQAAAKAKAKAAAKAKAEKKEIPVEPLQHLAVSAAELPGAALVARFLSCARAEWQQLKAKAETLELQAADRALVASEPPALEQLRPLIDLVEMRAPDDPESEKVEKVCRMSLANEHLAAEKAYLELTIGNSKWPIGGGEFLSSDGPQPGNRMWGQKLRKVKETPSILDNDSQKNAIQGLKRLLSFVQATESWRKAQ
ncbi:unnamed protein product [Cladocopium goreaui]|uniref:Pre-mRNA-splicing factor 18 n=1 Tax=Cladocopium goreaui TaxID=2562237 RepID=A0A9P1C6C2_9DINO|nr:unnamed protein product [Cladocopium goreaui]|mmetsp:Transcript_77434/g.171073  ORF Transcript_77434/g.171073 Transcript_77434/m.171073 type:complete len:227 (-) Transcript_77434:29-709(-)